MKNFLLLLIFLIFTQINIVKADPWDCMSKDQALSLVAYLKENPFVFDYCDCCDDLVGENEDKPMGHLIKIEKMEIVPCSYDDTQFSVSITKSTLIVSGYVFYGVFNPAEETSQEDKEKYTNPWNISLNFCFAMISEATQRLYQVINYDAENVECGGLKEFPLPKMLGNHPLKKAYTNFYDSK
jgi:hypothetical protein